MLYWIDSNLIHKSYTYKRILLRINAGSCNGQIVWDTMCTHTIQSENVNNGLRYKLIDKLLIISGAVQVDVFQRKKFYIGIWYLSCNFYKKITRKTRIEKLDTFKLDQSPNSNIIYIFLYIQTFEYTFVIQICIISFQINICTFHKLNIFHKISLLCLCVGRS